MKSLILALSLLFVFNAATADIKAQSVNLSGRVFNKNNKVENAIFYLYRNDILIDSLTTKKNGKFKLNLIEDLDYTILINKKGYLTKTIHISIKKEDNSKSVPAFKFDIELHKSYEFRYANTNFNMRPAAYIFFNESLGMLDWDRNVTSLAKSQITQLKKESMNNRREKFKSF